MKKVEQRYEWILSKYNQMDTKETPNYWEWMSYLQDFWCMCWDTKFVNKEEIQIRCHCSDLIKKNCLALCDMLRWDYPNKEKMILKFISLTKEYITKEFTTNK